MEGLRRSELIELIDDLRSKVKNLKNPNFNKTFVEKLKQRIKDVIAVVEETSKTPTEASAAAASGERTVPSYPMHLDCPPASSSHSGWNAPLSEQTTLQPESWQFDLTNMPEASASAASGDRTVPGYPMRQDYPASSNDPWGNDQYAPLSNRTTSQPESYPIQLIHVPDASAGAASGDRTVPGNAMREEPGSLSQIRWKAGFTTLTKQDLVHRVEKQMVCLESWDVKSTDVLFFDTITCVIRALDMPVGKVKIRYTTDNWKTCTDSFAKSRSSDGRMSRYPVEFFVNWLENGQRIEFAICYSTYQRDYWDNNLGQNYSLIYTA